MRGVLPLILLELESELQAFFRFGKFSFNKADIMLPTWLKGNRSIPDDCTTLTLYTVDNFYWYVPVIQYPRWQAIIRVFQPWLWVLVTTTFLFGSLTFWLITKFQNSNETSVILILMNTLLSYTGNAMNYKFKGAVYLVFFLLWQFQFLCKYLPQDFSKSSRFIPPEH